MTARTASVNGYFMARKTDAKKGFLSRLIRNEAGNTLAMTAAVTIPLLGMIGGGVDVSRLYLIKTRLQQACDAGALAGRKAQAGGSWNTAAGATADQVFAANFETNSYGTTSTTHSYSENSGTVTGTASVVVPMMIMKLFGNTQKTISVTCDAQMQLPNSDVMFVLDVTGSMAWAPSSGGTTSKLDGLKTAVQCFYETLMKTDTPANCGSTPSGGISNLTQIRFGFVPYNVNVNVGKLLPNNFMADNWTYQSRITKPTGSNSTNYGTWQYVSGSLTNDKLNNQSICPADTAVTVNQPPSTTTTTDALGGTVTTILNVRTTNGINYVCNKKKNGKYNIDLAKYINYVENKTDVTSPNYTYVYEPRTMKISALKAGGSSWNSSVMLPIGWQDADTNVNWDGCIEERQTVRASSYTPLPAGAYDLDIDMVPTSDPKTQWGPALEDAVWGRYSGSSWWNYSYSSVTTTANLSHNIYYACPTPARKLASYTTPSQTNDFVNYVNSLSASGNTYHDIGLLWGARLMSPTGIFASENAFTPAGGQIQRHMIFMTDGDACTGTNNYTAYGINWWDRRETDPNTAPTGGCTSSWSPGTLTDQVNARAEALCTAIKNKNITLWVINYGGGVSTTTGAFLKSCASPNRYYEATSVTDLLTTFQQIAAQISELRLTG